MSDMPETIYIDPHSPELDWCYAPLDEMFIEYVRADKYAELEQKLVWAQSAADGRAEHPWKVRCDELEAKNKRLVETILSEVEYYQPNGEYMPETEAFYCGGVIYGLEKAAAIVKAALKEKDDE